MTFWHYIVIGCIVQAIIIVERQIRLPWLRQDLKESSTNPFFWVSFIMAIVMNVLSWPLTIYCEIRLIQNGL